MLIIAATTMVSLTPNQALAAVKKTTATNISVKTTMKWDASALKIITKPSSFDRSNVIRNAYIKKVENYARRNKIKVITAKVVNGMRE